jgi:hypothetical protein
VSDDGALRMEGIPDLSTTTHDHAHGEVAVKVESRRDLFARWIRRRFWLCVCVSVRVLWGGKANRDSADPKSATVEIQTPVMDEGPQDAQKAIVAGL